MNDEVVASHAKKLRYLRKKSNNTQVELATHLGLSQQAYSKLENGETAFSDETIEKISGFFRITPAQFEEADRSIGNGSNNSNNTYSNNSIDEKMIDTFISMYEQNKSLISQNRELVNQLLKEKDDKIKLLESLITKE